MTSSDQNDAWRFLAKGTPLAVVTNEDGAFESLVVARWFRATHSSASWRLQIGDVSMVVAKDLRGHHYLVNESRADLRVAVPTHSKRWCLTTRIGARKIERQSRGQHDRR